MKLLRIRTEMLLYIAVLCVLQDFETVRATRGGPCLSASQRQCQTEGSHLWIAVHGNHKDKVCRYFGLYHKCVVSHMSKCSYNPKERELHRSDVVHHYVDPPYNCPFPAQSLGKTSYIRKRDQTNSSTNKDCNATILCIAILLQIIHFCYQCK